MGLNLLGIVKFSLPPGPEPEIWESQVPPAFAPITAGFAFGAEQLLHFDGETDSGRDIYLTASKILVKSDLPMLFTVSFEK